MKTVDLEQGSAQWLQWRKQHPTASYAACILGCARWNPRNWDQLAEVYRGERRIFVSKAMRFGSEMEPVAREALEQDTGLVFEPQVVVDADDFIAASLDGITFDGELICEIKCPYKGTESATWQDICNDDVPPYYLAQVQQQLLVSGAAKCIFAVWAEGMIEWREIHADTDMQSDIANGWRRFNEQYELWPGRGSEEAA